MSVSTTVDPEVTVVWKVSQLCIAVSKKHYKRWGEAFQSFTDYEWVEKFLHRGMTYRLRSVDLSGLVASGEFCCVFNDCGRNFNLNEASSGINERDFLARDSGGFGDWAQ